MRTVERGIVRQAGGRWVLKEADKQHSKAGDTRARQQQPAALTLTMAGPGWQGPLTGFLQAAGSM